MLLQCPEAFACVEAGSGDSQIIRTRQGVVVPDALGIRGSSKVGMDLRQVGNECINGSLHIVLLFVANAADFTQQCSAPSLTGGEAWKL